MQISQAQEKYRRALRKTSLNQMMRHNIELAHRSGAALDDGWDVFALPVDPPPTQDPGLGELVFDSAHRIGEDGLMTSETAVVFFDKSMAGWSYIVIA